jgi:hypothetical protein
VTWAVVGVNPPQSRREIRVEDIWPALQITFHNCFQPCSRRCNSSGRQRLEGVSRRYWELCDWHRQRGKHQVYETAAIGAVLHFWQIVWLELADPTSASLRGWLFRKQHANHKRIPTVPDQTVFHYTEISHY